MGVKVTDRTYTNPYRAETTSYLRANTGDWINVELEVESEVRNDYTLTNTVSFVSQNRLINLNGSEWRQQGFDVGDTITIRFSYNGIATPAVNTTRVILDIQGSELTYDSTDIIPSYTNILPSSTSVDSGGGTYVTVDIVDVIVSADKRPASLDFEYGLISNQDFSNTNLASFVDNSTITFRESGLDTLVGSKTLTQLGLKSGLGLANPTIEYIGVTSFRYKYVISFDMFINSFFEEDLNGVENGVYPSVLLDSNALTDNFKFAFQPEDGNPNVVIKSDPQLTKQLGNTGWLDESYNGNENDFVVDSITYEDTLANPLTELDYANATVVNATISGVPNLGVGTSDFALGFIYLPKQETEFKELKTQYHENLYANTCGVNKTFSLVANGGAFDATVYNGFTKDDAYVSISDIRFQVGSDPLTVEVQYTVTPNASWNTKMEALSENNRAYGLWISCADRTLTTTASDRVSLLLDTNLMTLQPVQFGSYPGLTNLYIANYEEQADAGNSTANVFPQDNFASKLSFTNDLTDNITINSIDFRIELVHASDGRKYELDSFIADLTSQPTDSNDVQQFNYLGNRGFLIDESTNDKNIVSVTRDSSLDSGSVYGYSAYCGLKERYEDWIERTDLPSEAYDVLEENDGYNNFWFYLDSLTDWSVKYVVQIGADADGTVGVYRNEFDIAHQTYDSNIGFLPTVARYYRQLDNTLINDAILKRGELVRVEYDFQLITDTFNDFANAYSEIQIEEEFGGGWKTTFLLNNLGGAVANSPIYPIAGETTLKMDLVSANLITLTAEINGDLLPVVRYRISPELKASAGSIELCFNVVGSTSFTPSIVGTETPTWTLGDGSPDQVTKNCSRVYADTNTYEVCLQMIDYTTVTSFTANNDDLLGVLNLSLLTSVRIINLVSNRYLTSIIAPISTAIGQTMYGYSCAKLETVDLSGYSGLGGNVRFYSCPKLTTILFPTTSVIGNYLLYSNNLTGTIDMSGVSGLSSTLHIHNNPKLNQLILPTTSNIISQFYAYNCDLVGELDISGLTGLRTNFRVYGNRYLTSVKNPISTEVISNYWVNDCNIQYIDFKTIGRSSDINIEDNLMPSLGVSQILMDLSGVTWAGICNINISGTNDAPNDDVFEILSKVSGGSGYVAGEVLTPTGISGAGAQITINTVDGLGGILTYTLTSGGSGYLDPITSYVGGSGSGADFIVTGGEIAKADLVSKGWTVTTS